MYRYDAFDQSLVEQRVAQFRDQVARRLNGELSEAEFKPLRLMNGLYLQLHAYMLRIAIPYGTLSAVQLRKLAQIARRYDRGYGHFTTRQNLQLNWIKLEETPDILAELAEVEMHAIQTSGNCIRNVTADHYAGVAEGEIEDPRIYAEIIRQWSTLHPEFSFLPRKFKIAITGTEKDRAAVRVHDIGLRMCRNLKGEVGFEIIVGGGLGRTPVIGKTIRDFLPKHHLLSYLEAILRVYNQLGRRDNLYKARIKILVNQLTIDVFRDMVESEWAAQATDDLTLPQAEIDRVAAFFVSPLGDTSTRPLDARETEPERGDPDFTLWAKTNLAPHKAPGHKIVNISLKATGAVPGDASAEQMEAIADLAESYSHGEIRVTHEQNLVLPYVADADLPAVWRGLKAQGLATPNIGLISDIIACPGLDYCHLANARAIPVAQKLSERFAALSQQHDIGALKIKISGCINACGHHHVGNIGVLGVDKKGEEFYQITLGGNAGETPALGRILGPAFPYDEVPNAVERIVETYQDLRENGETFNACIARLGLAPFKEKLYGSH